MKQGAETFSRRWSKKFALLFVVVSTLINNFEPALASHDGFLFGPDATITNWDAALSAEDFGVSASCSSLQTSFNQAVVDHYLAQTYVLAALDSREPKFKKRLFKLSLENSERLVNSSFKNDRGNRALRIFVLLQLQRKVEAKQEIASLVALLRETPAPSALAKLQKERSNAARSDRTSCSSTLIDLARRFQRAGDSLSANYLERAADKLNLLEPDGPVPAKTVADQQVETLYQQGAAASAKGNLEEAQEKFKQALELQEKTMSDKLLRAFDSRLALVRTLVALDQPELAQDHFNQVIERLKQISKIERPQTADLLSQYMGIVETDLNETDLNETDLSEADWRQSDLKKSKELVKGAMASNITPASEKRIARGLNSLITAAYLCKIDGNLSQAAHLFRRAYLINHRYFPHSDEQLGSICYDLGETLYWSSDLEEAEHYMQEALRLREKNGRDCVEAINLRGTLGRILIIGGRGEAACRFYMETLRLLAGKSFAKSFEAAKGLDFSQLIVGLTAVATDSGNALNPDFKSQFEDALQSLADAAISCKHYDQAIASDQALLYLREEKLLSEKTLAAKSNQKEEAVEERLNQAREQVVATLWQLGWVTSMIGNLSAVEDSNKYYGRLITEFPSPLPRPLADWYQARAISFDLLGKYPEAKRDFSEARKLFRKHLRQEKDQEQIDIVTWTIDDITYNLHSRRKSPASDRDYLKAEPNSFWRASRFPLKVFVETSASNGFGGSIRELMHKAMEQWSKYENSPISLTYVSDMDSADVYIERVTSYDDIPYGSAGRTSAVYEKDNKRALDRAHVRVYCPSYDGFASRAEGALDKIENQEMTSFAKTQLYTLFMHEFGHVLGLGHSPGGQDVMYWKSCSTELTERDKESIRRLYKLNK